MRRQENDGYWSELYIVYGAISPIKCSCIDICEPYITGDVRSPLLRIVPVEIRSHNYAFDANLVKHFSFPNYLIATNEFQNDRNRYKRFS